MPDRPLSGSATTNAIVAYLRYMGKFFWPTNLAVFYPSKEWHPGLVYGSITRRPPLDRVQQAVAVALAVSLLPMAAATSFAVMLLLVIPAGMFIAPLLATRNELIGRVAPAGARTEAYTWPVTAFVGGISIGSALAGGLVEGPGWRFAFVVASAFAGLGALVVFVRRQTFVTPVPR